MLYQSYCHMLPLWVDWTLKKSWDRCRGFERRWRGHCYSAKGHPWLRSEPGRWRASCDRKRCRGSRVMKYTRDVADTSKKRSATKYITDPSLGFFFELFIRRDVFRSLLESNLTPIKFSRRSHLSHLLCSWKQYNHSEAIFFPCHLVNHIINRQ